MATADSKLNVSVNLKNNTGPELRRLESSVIRTVGAISAAFASIQAILFPITNAATFERAMADVAKTTGYGAAEIESLSLALVDMSTQLGISAKDLADVAAIAGQLGLGDEGIDSIEAFTESVARASVTLGISVQKAAEGGAQLAAIYGKSVSEIEKLFATINELSNNSVAAGSDIIDIMKRVGTSAGAELQEVAALAAAVRQLGVPNEQAGTGLTKALTNMLSESKKFANAMGLSQDEWVAKVEANTTDALKYVYAELSKMDAAQQALYIKTLFGAGRLFSLNAKLVGDAANGHAVINEMLGLSIAAYDKGTSSIEEYNKIMDTTVQQMKVMKESFVALGIQVGSAALPHIQKYIEGISEALKSDEVIAFFDELGDSLVGMVDSMASAGSAVADFGVNWRHIAQALKIVAGIGLATMAAGWALALGWTLLSSIGKLHTALLFLVNVVGKVVAAWKYMTSFILLSTGTNQIALWAAGATTGLSSLTLSYLASFGAMTKANGVWVASFLAVKAAWFSMVAFVGGALMANIYGALLIAIFLFWDKITTWLGFVSKEQQIAETEARVAKKKAERLRKEAIAAAEAAKKTLDKLYADISVGEAEGFELYLDTEQAQKNLQKVYDRFIKIQKVMKDTQDALDLQKGAAEVAFAAEAKAQEDVVRVQKQLNDLLHIRSTATLWKNFGEDNLLKLKERIEDLTIAFWEAKRIADQYRTSQEKLQEQLAKGEGLLDTQIDPDIERRMTKQASAYAYSVLMLSQYKDSLAEVNAELKDLVDIQGKTKQDTDKIDDLKALKESYEGIVTSLTEQNTTLAATFDEVSKGLAKRMNNLPTGVLRYLVDKFRDVDFQAKELNKTIAKKQEPGIKLASEALKKLNEEYKEAYKNADRYATSAESAFNNVGKEVDALYSRVRKFGLDLKRAMIDRDAELTLDIKIDGIDKKFDKASEAIDDRFDQLEENYQRWGIAYSQKAMDARRESAHEAVEANKIIATSDAKAKALAAEFNRELENRNKLLEQAKEASALGNAGETFVLKTAAKDSIQRLMDLTSEMNNLRTLDNAGIEVYHFSEGKIREAYNQIAQGAEDTGKEIYSIMEALKDSTAEARKNLKEGADVILAAANALQLASDNIAKGIVASKGKEVTQEIEIKPPEDIKELVAKADDIGRIYSLLMVKAIASGLSEDEAKRRVTEAIKVLLTVPAEAKVELEPVIIEKPKSFYDTTGTLKMEVKESQLRKELGYIQQTIAKNPANVTAHLVAREAEIKKDILKLSSNLNAIVPATFEVDKTQGIFKPGEEPEGVFIKAEIPEDSVQNEVDKQGQSYADLVATFKGQQIQEEVSTYNGMVLNIIANIVGFKGLSTVNVNGVQNNREGGYISGPGTGTSDSILSWLSNGEYVMDAFTTNFFGSGFFSGLQSIAKRSSTASSKLGLPAFASGGLATSMASAGVGASDSVDLNFNIADNSYKVTGEREQIKGLVKAMKYIRGGSR